MYYIILWIYQFMKFIIFDIFSYIFIFKPYCYNYSFYMIRNNIIIPANSYDSSLKFYKNKYHALFRLKSKQYTGLADGRIGYEKVIEQQK